MSAIFVGLVVLALISGLRHMGKLAPLELAAYDWLTRLKPKSSGANPHITIIGISEDDIDRHGWPLTDETLAETLSILLRHRPRAIGVDIFRDKKIPPGTDKLESIWKANPKIIGVMEGFGRNGEVPPPFPLRDPNGGGFNENQVGFNDIPIDPGGTVRRGLLFIDDGEKFYYAFSLRLALHYLAKEGIFPHPDQFNPDLMMLGQTTITPLDPQDGGYVGADTGGYQYLIDFHENSRSFETFSLSSLHAGRISSDRIRERIVLIGVIDDASVKDIFSTPLKRYKESQLQTPGVVLHAHMISQLLRYGQNKGAVITPLKPHEEIFWILCWCIAGSLTAILFRSPFTFAMAAPATLTGLTLVAFAAILGGLWIPLIPPLLGYGISCAFLTVLISHREMRHRVLLMNLFSRQVSPEIAKTIWNKRDQFSDGGRPRPQELCITVLYLQFTMLNAVTGEKDPAYIVEWINAYVEPALKLISRYGGTVDDCSSDGIKANFGFPIPRQTDSEIKKDAVNAIECALLIEKEVKRLNTVWEKHGYPAGSIQIGIASGKAFAAALGYQERVKYTAIGRPVYIASMLARYHKAFMETKASSTLVSETVVSYAGEDFRIRRLGSDKLEESKDKISVYHVLGHS